MKKVIEAKNIRKTFRMGDVEVHALQGVDIIVEKGEFISIMGSSGSGKSTLMNLLGCLDKPTSGDYFLEGVNVSSLSQKRYAELRNRHLGFVFQGFNLLSRTTALENVMLPLLYCRDIWFDNPVEEAIRELKRVGLYDRMHHVPSQLSGGQQQRVAIARALVNKPALILADEPTGNLDSVNSLEIMALFQELNDQGVTVVLVTHEDDIAQCSKRVIKLKDGLIYKEYMVEGRKNALDELKQYHIKNETGVVI